MTAPTSTSSMASTIGQPHARTLSSGNTPCSEQHCEGDEDDAPQLDQPHGSSRPSNPHQPLSPATLDAGESHPELDEFVNEFYDGDRLTDVDSRVWA